MAQNPRSKATSRDISRLSHKNVQKLRSQAALDPIPCNMFSFGVFSPDLIYGTHLTPDAFRLHRSKGLYPYSVDAQIHHIRHEPTMFRVSYDVNKRCSMFTNIRPSRLLLDSWSVISEIEHVLPPKGTNCALFFRGFA